MQFRIYSSSLYTFMNEDKKLAEIQSMQALYGELVQQTLECADLSFITPRLRTHADIRMTRAARRRPTKIEDLAYFLMGISNISLPITYGGERSFCRLIEVIMKSGDPSTTNWRGEPADHKTSRETCVFQANAKRSGQRREPGNAHRLPPGCFNDSPSSRCSRSRSQGNFRNYLASEIRRKREKEKARNAKIAKKEEKKKR
ncbi:hypothetical protein M405DRAFT_933938 [Rhizopogon salebrosus TDB-379]|nr:hypothetical protein M405DRAFT_933938 [Rhizopogon salebrosus TDB-379]